MNILSKKLLKIINLAVVAMFVFTLTSCEKKSDTIIDPSLASPIISDLYKSKDTALVNPFDPVLNFRTSLKVDLNGGGFLNYVKCDVVSPLTGLVLSSFQMNDNGSGGDSTSGDNRFSCTVNITKPVFDCLVVGVYKLRYSAENNSGLISNTLISNISVISSNNFPPYVAGVNMPDSVVRPSTGQFDLTLLATVKDTNGSCDIKDVYFDAYRPSGSYIGRIPMTREANNFELYKFTNPVLPSNADSSYGYFKYFFQATDNSGAISDFFKDSIKFVRPNP
jgi:hypothetical protein